MLETKRWLDRNLVNVGFAMFSVGMVLLAFGTVAVFIEQVAGSSNWGFESGPWSFFKGIVWVASLHYGLGSSLAWIGGVFYCLGRFLEQSFVTIVGFGQTTASELVLRGPDEDDVVWIGRRYKSPIDAQLAFDAFSKRIEIAK